MSGSYDFSENQTFAVVFTIVAAASQGLGGCIAVLGASEGGKSVAHLMSFSTGVMLYLSFMDIMADTVSKIGDMHANIAFFTGMVLFLALEFCLPEVESTAITDCFGLLSWKASQPEAAPPQLLPVPEEDAGDAAALRSRARGKPRASTSPARRGSPARERAAPSPKRKAPKSPPPSEKRKAFEAEGERSLTERRKKSIAFTATMTMVSISLHNIPEGIAVYLTCLKGIKSGLPLAVAMALHNIPEGMAVAGPLYAATKSKVKAVLAATISGGFEVVGCMLVQVFFHRITPFFMDLMLSLVAGIMVGLSLIELLPSCLEVLSPKAMGCSCIGGMAFMFCAKSLSHELLNVFDIDVD